MDTKLQQLVTDLAWKYPVQDILECLAMHCAGKAATSKERGHYDIAKDWQHAAMWINSIVGKVTV